MFLNTVICSPNDIQLTKQEVHVKRAVENSEMGVFLLSLKICYLKINAVDVLFK